MNDHRALRMSEEEYRIAVDRSEANETRATALEFAVQVTCGQGDPASTLRAAKMFAAFITGADTAN